MNRYIRNLYKGQEHKAKYGLELDEGIMLLNYMFIMFPEKEIMDALTKYKNDNKR